MSTIRNYVQLIGNVGQAPTITQLQNGKKIARFSMATNEPYKTNEGEKWTDCKFQDFGPVPRKMGTSITLLRW
nr:single-stranded DNA-binding protein [Euzebyella saccharophila]